MHLDNKDEGPKIKASLADGAIYRLHHSTVWLLPFVVLGRLIIPALIMSVLWDSLPALHLFIFILFIPTVLYLVYRYLTLSIQLIDNELIIKSGKIIKNDRRIHFDRVQDIEIHQNILMRIFNVAKIQVTTAASDKKEASLETLVKSDAEALKQAFINYQKGAVQTPGNNKERLVESEQVVCRLSVEDLIIGGFATFTIAAVMTISGSILYFFIFNRVAPRFVTEFGINFSDNLQDALPEFALASSFFNLLNADTLFKIVILVIVGLMFSIMAYVIRYHGYQLTRSGEVFTKRYGLFTKKKASIDRNRVQALKVEERILHRVFHLIAIRVDSAGDNNHIQDNKKRDLMVPIMAKELSPILINKIFNGLSPIENWTKVSKQSVIRGSKVLWFILFCILAFSFPIVGLKSLILLPAFPFAYFLNYQWYRFGGYCLDDAYVLRRWGWLNRETLYLPIKNIQNVSVSQGPFDRRRNLATLSIDTAGQSNTGGGPKIRHLPYEEALRLQQLLAKQISNTEFTW